MDDIKTNVSAIKTAAVCGAMRAFCGFASVDAMLSIPYDERGLRGDDTGNVKSISYLLHCKFGRLSIGK